jgi:hypothetical protein
LVELLHQISKKFFLVFAKEAALQTKAVLAQIKQRFIRKRKKKRKGCKKKNAILALPNYLKKIVTLCL